MPLLLLAPLAGFHDADVTSVPDCDAGRWSDEESCRTRLATEFTLVQADPPGIELDWNRSNEVRAERLLMGG
ncbi:MAG: hypothetical protein V4850_34795 [Myxococcota bacterium]